jgi:hypothetical protein
LQIVSYASLKLKAEKAFGFSCVTGLLRLAYLYIMQSQQLFYNVSCVSFTTLFRTGLQNLKELAVINTSVKAYIYTTHALPAKG